MFALGGKSLITLLYTEGSAVPDRCELSYLSADARNLGRTYATKLVMVGDIKISLTALLPLLVSASRVKRRPMPRYARPLGASKRHGASSLRRRLRQHSMRRSSPRSLPLEKSPALSKLALGERLFADPRLSVDGSRI